MSLSIKALSTLGRVLTELGQKAEVPASKILGGVVASLREQAGLKQKHLAEMMGVLQTGLSKIEAGHSTMDMNHLRAAAEALGTSPSKILQLVEEVEETLKPHNISVTHSTREKVRTGKHLRPTKEEILELPQKHIIAVVSSTVAESVTGRHIIKEAKRRINSLESIIPREGAGKGLGT
jgi:transcriptional regulator with XRE-family HTH domain